MPQREGPRLEKVQHASAEERLRESIWRREHGFQWDYEGRDEDLARVRRWRKERNEAGRVGR